MTAWKEYTIDRATGKATAYFAPVVEEAPEGPNAITHLAGIGEVEKARGKRQTVKALCGKMAFMDRVVPANLKNKPRCPQCRLILESQKNTEGLYA